MWSTIKKISFSVSVILREYLLSPTKADLKDHPVREWFLFPIFSRVFDSNYRNGVLKAIKRFDPLPYMITFIKSVGKSDI